MLLARGRVGYRRWRDREIEPIEKCPVLLPELESALGALASKLGASAPGSENPACESEWELAAGVGQRVRSVALGDDALEAASEQQWVELEAGESRIRISPGVFAQSNPLMYDILISQVTDALSGVRPGTMLELFAGAGFFTVGLARRFERVVAVESDTRATADLEHNLAVAGLRGVEVLTARAEQALAKLEQCRPDAVLLDPPRVGLARGAAQQLAELGAERIAYLSCDPATLARDLAVICTDPTTGASRYELSSLTGFDLFPQTPHVEALAVLDRAG
ncbi:MAG: class I SAM-dependent RNA methyltransferase [bacterium]|nr:class I SAM-dependent RNA methyltransferase [bacterium]